MTSQQEAIKNLEARANAAVAHIDDIEYIVEHKDQLTALMLLQAMSDDSPELANVKATSLEGIKDALKHGENALLVRALSTPGKDELFSSPSMYVTALSIYALCELNNTPMPIKEPPYEDMWALSVLIGLHYEPVPSAPFTREQLVKAMEEDDEGARTMESNPSQFILALDCGTISPEEVKHYQQAPAYQRARAVWKLIYDQVMGTGGYISARTMINYGHAFITAYGENVPRERQLQAFHIMDRYRQEHPGLTFAQLPNEGIADLFRMRNEAMSKAPTALSFSAHDAGTLYETHTPRVRVFSDEGQVPVPIAPPFESIPLYREKQPQERKVKKSRPFLERFYLMKRLTYERSLAEKRLAGASSKQRYMLTAVEQSLLTAAEASRKYRFANSAQALVHTLMEQETGTTIKMLPETGIFIEFVTPLDLGAYTPVAGLFFVSPLQAYRAGNYAKLFSEAPERALDFWVLNVLEEDGDVLMNIIYDTDWHTWKVPEVRQCPDNACRQAMSMEEAIERGASTIWQMCPKCEKIARYFSRWLPIALLAIAGEFAEEAEPVEREVTETITRKEKRPDSKKYDERTEEVRFRIVTFDASVKRKTETEPVEPRETGTSWLDLAVEQGTVVYVKRGFGKSVRNLDPARNARWKYKREVPVRAYEKRIPMTVANLQRVITKVVASKYE